jgi:hypothetical protein
MARLQQSSEPADRRKWIVLAVIMVLGGAAAGTYWHTAGPELKPVAEAAKPPNLPKPSEPQVPAAPANPQSKLVVGLPPITKAPVNPAPAPQPNHKAQDIPEDKLNAAGAALVAVYRVRNDYQQRIATARSHDRKRLIDEGDNALQKAIADKGLSIDEYKAILDLAQNDPNFQAKPVERANAAQNR